jgi:NSS family neurotransmitter:Na+ symporter
MNQNKIWQGNWTFILAAAGSAVGLGNIWKFPYMVGTNGGSAFVLIYLFCILLIGLPVMMAETYLGRYGRKSPINSIKKIVADFNLSSYWKILGWIGAIAGLMILSYYSVFAGIATAYIFNFMPSNEADPVAYSLNYFSEFVGSPMKMIFWHTLFLSITCFIVGKGVIDGIGKTINFLMPTLFFLIILLCIYSSFTGDFLRAFNFLFDADFSKISISVIIAAMGQAFFTLSIGMGAIMAYGAYMPEDQPIGKTIPIIIILDTSVALFAGLTIFPIVFSNPILSVSSGPGLLFETLPVAFSSLPFGSLFASIFFILISIAAVSSSVSLIEPFTAWVEEQKIFTRKLGVIILGLFAWVLGLGSIFSFNIWQDVSFFGFDFLSLMDFLTNNIMLPLGGLTICILVGWVLEKDKIRAGISLNNSLYNFFIICLKYIAPLSIGAIFLSYFLF